jgi:hypothetical protein
MSGEEEEPVKATIDAVDEHGTAQFEISSPRSLRALLHCALTCGQLQYRSFESFAGEDVPKKVAKMRFESEEELRQRRIALVKKEYRAICRAEYDENVDIVLSDLALGVEKYICDRSDIYHPEVAVELKHVVVVAGRCYKRKKVPEGSQTPGLKQIAHELHDSVREVAVRDGLVPEAAEWEKVPLKVGREQVSEVESVVDQSTDERVLCVEDLKTQYYLPPSEWGTLTQRYGTSNTTVSILEDPRYRREKTPVHPRSTEIQELMRQLPDASFEECDDALLRTGDLDDASDLLREKFAEIRFGLRPVDATAEMSARVAEPVDHCLHCGTDCKWNTRFTCARCRTRTYCSRECMREDWLAEHSVQCVVLLPLLNSASSYGLSASGRFRAVAPRKAMPALWHSTENKLTHLYGLQDWSGVVELEHDVSLAARAVLADWPEVSLAMYSMLADCRRALGNNDQVILWHERCIEAARHVGNDELEAKTLASVAEFSQSVKNYHKAIDLLKLSLPLWSKVLLMWCLCVANVLLMRC